MTTDLAIYLRYDYVDQYGYHYNPKRDSALVYNMATNPLIQSGRVNGYSVSGPLAAGAGRRMRRSVEDEIEPRIMNTDGRRWRRPMTSLSGLFAPQVAPDPYPAYGQAAPYGYPGGYPPTTPYPGGYPPAPEPYYLGGATAPADSFFYEF